MKSIELKVTRRNSLGKKASKSLRKNQQVPCVMYGGKENIHFTAHENSFREIVYTHDVYLINLDVEGKKYDALMKEIQFHPVTDKINHIDFVEISTNKPAVVGIPVEITGNSVGIRGGGKLRQRKRYVRVNGLVKDIPDSLVIDISDLDIGQSVQAGDVKLDKLEILEPHHAMIVGVISSRAAAKGMGEEEVVAPAPVAEGAQPEAAPAETKKEKE
jgi:large subunit ribosomal protein L25